MKYTKPEDLKIAQIAAVMSSSSYEHWGKISRVQEIIEFAKSCGYKKIGLAFCNSFKKYAEIVQKLFCDAGLETVSVSCFIGNLKKEEIGLNDLRRTAPLCNPIEQAELLNNENTDLNVVLGLCVGHDMLFNKYSHAPVTVLVVKDRVHNHNPLEAVCQKHC
jgi:uncharacterized metal-binding protein